MHFFVLITNITRRLANKQRKLHNADIEGGLGGDRPGRSSGGSFSSSLKGNCGTFGFALPFFTSQASPAEQCEKVTFACKSKI